MEAYCFKCKAKRDIKDPVAEFNAKGSPVTTGTCSVCGTKMFRMGNTDAHAGLERPVIQKTPGNKRPAKRSGKLVIVESPAKAKTVQRFLGKGYQVQASVGHVRDLLKSTLSVDVQNDFAPKYRVPNEKKAVVKEIKAKAAAAEEVFLATDPDREGEAISWHLLEAAEIEPALARRVVFHEITRPAIEEAFSHPREIDMRLVNAQQTRRILDRLVGYSLSPLLWAKVRGRLSAGRVQSVAVRLIVDREREIEAFAPQEYWTVEAELTKRGDTVKKHHFFARLLKVDEKDVGLEKEIPLANESEVKPLLADLEGAQWSVLKVKKGERRRSPPPPFTTSTLQQEASRRLNFTAKRTMMVAQQLYEGIGLNGDSAVGLITYMRTDSTNVSKIAQKEAREFVAEKYGADFLPPEPPQYKTRAKGAQEAHEAIRPTSAMREPKAIEGFLTKEQFRLYQLIWQRFVASQMAAAVYDTVSVDIEAKHERTYLFRAAGSVVKFPGFLAVYEEAKEEDAAAPDPAEGEGKRLPPLIDGDPLSLIRLIPEQHFTQPPPRYTEATLVKALEEYGIGRPSTYAPTIATIQQRGYVLREEKRLAPTETGIIVNDLLVDHFPEIVDVGFTARMEEELDEIAAGEREWTPVLHEFYGPFAQQVKAAEADMPNVNAGPEFVGRDCPLCGKPLVMRYGRYGKFIGCSGFPECRHVEPLLEKVGVACPKDGGDLIERKTRKGRVFYGCANYPNCDWTSWKKPAPQKCPACGGLMVAANKNTAACTVCGTQAPLETAAAEAA
ncbi:MAG: type I DNA topoisomerase [Chloroflexi bacterium]|nr:type I DNA topoisomerase [Chloroflexota bacterium]